MSSSSRTRAVCTGDFISSGRPPHRRLTLLTKWVKAACQARGCQGAAPSNVYSRSKRRQLRMKTTGP